MAVAACGDDDGGGSSEDGGVSLGDLDELDNRIDDVGGEVDDLGQDLDALSGNVDDINTNVDGLTDDVSGLDDRINDLENPEILSCSESDLCIPDGLDLVQEGVEPMVRAICEYELSCCTTGELALLWGAGIENVDDCVDVFMSMVDNGFVPTFLDINVLDSPGLLDFVIELAHALNETQISIELDAAGVAECVESLESKECPVYAEEGPEVDQHCDPDLEPPVDPCDIDNLVRGLQQPGEVCGVLGFNECADGNACREAGNGGICAEPAEAGDFCIDDYDCDPFVTELYCSENECTERGDVGDDCSYVLNDFSSNHSSLNPQFVGSHSSGWLFQNPSALTQECKSGTSCDPNSLTCVNYCSDGFLCNNNAMCPEGFSCNFVQNENLYYNFYPYNSTYLGVCREALALDDTCLVHSECGSNRCLLDVSTYTCAAALIEEGGDCTTGTAGIGRLEATCETEVCAAASTVTTAGVCATLCEENADCPSTHFCRYDVSPSFCDLKRANTVACAPGGDDNGSYDWNDVQCATGFCNTTNGQCADKSATVCASGQHSGCTAGKYCNTAVCTDILAVGDACTTDPSCGQEAHCDGTSAECEAFADPGDACTEWEDCNPLYDESANCVDAGGTSQCAEYGEFPIDADCNSDSDCTSGWCPVSTYTCTEPIAAGEDCNVTDPGADRCADGHFCKYSLDEEPFTGEGECTAQGQAGDGCDPRYHNGECLGNDCQLWNERFACGFNSQPEEDRVACYPAIW